MRKPLAIDVFCGLGGWSEGLLAEGYDVIGFDIERHRYPERILADGDGVKTGSAQNAHGSMIFNYANETRLRTAPLTGNWHRYPAQLVLQDVLTLHGSQFRNAALIVASPPCVEYSYMAMPWTRAKQIAAALRGQGAFPESYTGSRSIEQLNALFNACFRIQREASEAAGRYIPMVVENVKGAQPWVGPAAWHYGSFYLWGDVPALMPSERVLKVEGFRFDGSGRSFQTASVEACKVPSESGRRTDPPGKGSRFTSRDCGVEAVKNGNDWFGSGADCSLQRRASSRSNARKAASAQIAKIPEALARWIAKVYYPGLEYSNAANRNCYRNEVREAYHNSRG